MVQEGPVSGRLTLALGKYVGQQDEDRAAVATVTHGSVSGGRICWICQTFH